MTWRMPLLRRAFVGASVTWALALPLASLASSARHPSAGVYLFSFVVYLTGSLLCHQLPERSFHLWGSPMPVCARCVGIYAGAAISALIAVGARRSRAESASGGALQTARLALFVAVLPTAATLVYEWSTGRTPENWIRAAAGVPIGGVVAWIVCRLRPEAVEG